MNVGTPISAIIGLVIFLIVLDLFFLGWVFIDTPVVSHLGDLLSGLIVPLGAAGGGSRGAAIEEDGDDG